MQFNFDHLLLLQNALELQEAKEAVRISDRNAAILWTDREHEEIHRN
jgi:hypothetical protein